MTAGPSPEEVIDALVDAVESDAGFLLGVGFTNDESAGLPDYVYTVPPPVGIGTAWCIGLVTASTPMRVDTHPHPLAGRHVVPAHTIMVCRHCLDVSVSRGPISRLIPGRVDTLARCAAATDVPLLIPRARFEAAVKDVSRP